jgi:hypothetical protein
MITESVISAFRVVWPESSSVERSDGLSRSPTMFLGEPAGRAVPGSVESSVVLDFGTELYGGIRLEVVRVLSDHQSCRLRVRLGESVSEAMFGSSFVRNELVQGGSKLDLGVTGFRFARVDVDDTLAYVEISMPVAYCLAQDVPKRGSFSCDDARLDRVWEVGALTVQLCMQDLIWDGIKRGRTVWAGDLHPASNTIAAVFGPHPIVAASLDRLRDRTARAQGSPEWMNGIPAYSLWWIICQAEWYLYTGDRDYLEAQRSYLAGLLDVVFEDIDADGHEQFLGWRYLDWATTRDSNAVHVGYQGLTAWALRSAYSLLLALGDEELRDRCGKTLTRVESYHPPDTASKQSHALMVLGGLADPVMANRHVLAPNPVAGLTPFLGYSVLEARALAGDQGGALDLIRDYWGAMLDLGATTFWEDFDIDWLAGSGAIDAIVPDGLRDIHAGLGRNAERGMSLSLCHGWSAGPTAWLSRHVLGIRPVEPGCRIVRIQPELGDLSRANGCFPTPLGIIEVQHRRRPDGSIETEVEAPDSIEVIAGE